MLETRENAKKIQKVQFRSHGTAGHCRSRRRVAAAASAAASAAAAAAQLRGHRSCCCGRRGKLYGVKYEEMPLALK